MDDAVEITKKVETRERDFKPAFDIMDEDFKIWNVQRSSYDTAINAQTKKHGSDIEIISDSLRLFSDDVNTILSSSERQIKVRMAEAEGEDKREEMGKLERLLDFAFEKADERLTRIIQPPLKEFTIWCAAIRSCAAGRFLVYKGEGGTVIFDFLHYDPRYLVYRVGSTGLLWSAYTTFHSPEELEDEYGKDVTAKPWYKPWEKSKQSYKVIDYWLDKGKGKKTNAIICNKEFLKEPETYDLDSMPVLIVPVATRPPVTDSSNEVVGYSDSIFAPLRAINGIRNRFMSMIANHANLMANQALINYRTALGREINSTTNVPGGVLELTMGENKLEPSPMKEISPTVVSMSDWLGGQIEDGILPKSRLGEPPASGTAINLIQESGNRVLNPQVQCLNSFYAGACRLVEEQILAGGVGGEKIKKVKIRGEQKNKYYETEITPVDLKKPHIIKVTFTARTPWTQMDNVQLADMLIRQGLPKIWVWENILSIQDPKLLQDLLALEMYEQSPQGMMKRVIEVLVDKEYLFEAGKVAELMDKMEAQENAGTIPPGGETGEAEESLPFTTA